MCTVHVHCSCIIHVVYCPCTICNLIWENPAYCYSRENRDCDIYQQYHIRYYIRTITLTPIASSVSELSLFAIAQTIELEKSRSKHVATHAHMASVYFACTIIDFRQGVSI